ncbi:MAG TPA: metallopeptidase family protein [Candidatus Baltobacteraceae bacterium]|jgi:predicted Zn-dependent protease with MMP-like domain|nr:metallopeptidase family protein [Candidatus Baltobacteraceae bacterium]
MLGGDLTRAEFEDAVVEALDSLPKRFADLVENVSVTVEDEPDDRDLREVGPEAGDDRELLGIYRGVALTERTHGVPLLPDEITIFRGPITRVARSRNEVIRQVQKTVIHELGHYFGLRDDEMSF